MNKAEEKIITRARSLLALDPATGRAINSKLVAKQLRFEFSIGWDDAYRAEATAARRMRAQRHKEMTE